MFRCLGFRVSVSGVQGLGVQVFRCVGLGLGFGVWDESGFG